MNKLECLSCNISLSCNIKGEFSSNNKNKEDFNSSYKEKGYNRINDSKIKEAKDKNLFSFKNLKRSKWTQKKS